MCKGQLEDAYRKKDADGVAFVEGEWDEGGMDCNWEEHLPFGYAADGVRVRSCRNCNLTLVFDLDSRERPLVDNFGEEDEPCNFRHDLSRLTS